MTPEEMEHDEKFSAAFSSVNDAKTITEIHSIMSELPTDIVEDPSFRHCVDDRIDELKKK